MFRTRHILLLPALLCLWSGSLRAQGTVRGTVSDANGETLIGASVALKGQNTGVGTDFDGKFSLAIKDSVAVTIVASYQGYRPQERTVNPKAGEVVLVDFVLQDENVELKEFTIEGRVARDKDPALTRQQFNAPNMWSFVSRDLAVKTGDGDAAALMRRVTGVSTVGAFVTVRGLADRYLVTSVNGSRIPTLDPLTNNIKLDLFPTGLMDNIIITKTATPDLPGDWSGAYVSLNTSDYPERLQVSVSTMIGFNPNSSFNDIVTSQRSTTDWLGWDDGLRAIPDGVPADVEGFPQFIEPNLYQQLGILGLGNWLSQYGIVGSTPAFQSANMGTTSSQQHLALTQLGLLAPALLYDANAIQQAVNTYNSTYDLAYFSPLLNSGLAGLNTRFNNEHWRVVESSGMPNFNQSFSIGNQVQLFKKKEEPMTLGYLFGFRYATETEYDPSSTLVRTGEPYADATPGDDYGKSGTQKISTESNGWNALANLSLKIDRNNSINLLVMPNVLGQNNARYQEFLQPNVGTETFVSEDQFYEQRKLWVQQLGSEHFIPAFNMKVKADVSWSNGERDMLDLRTVQYILPPPGQPITDVDGALSPPSRIYRFMDETMLDAKASFELPLKDDPRKPRKLKFGAAWFRNERTNTQSYFTVLGAPGPAQWNTPGRFEMQADGRFLSQYAPFGTFKDNDIGILNVQAGFVMSDFYISPRLRAVGGVRAEHTDLLTDILRYHEQGLAADDPARGTVGDLTIPGGSNPEQKPASPGVIDQWDVLPSLNLVFKLKNDENAPMNLRAGYFRSLGRPSFREFSVVQLFDYVLSAPVYGNPALKMTSIDNFDLRVERMSKEGNSIAISGFYKVFQNHIELLYTTAGGFTWRNARTSRVVGGELEGRIGIWKGLEWRGNVTLMGSRSELTTVLTEKPIDYSTPMFGQAPYIVNTTFSYSADSIGLVVSASYNVQGPKLAISNSEVNPEGIRAYEMPRHMVDLTASKQLGEHWGVRLRVRDLLRSSYRRSYLFASGYAVDFDRYTYGTEYALTVSYTIK